MGLSFYPDGVFCSNQAKFFTNCFLTVDLERKTGITGVPFGRTELSIRASCRIFSALSSREGPVGPGIQGIPEKFDFHDFFGPFFTKQI